ncbi:transcriptional regulator [Amylolactobacillus amylotrophicus DSM 20534]|uniref:Uncharacterized protein n=3 Tax=Amylolactobacillus TaxID=2767876 RepID=A0A1L6XEB7_9LACO|nr:MULTISPECIES: MurR/RpiR family transcriptional regulator [Amylolactobacillus]APT19316.1 hypothetical protein LA20533_05200 [Amylolactobacillus amylophilus DSM 20533 = JCM 1125]KRK37740.1 transcriptional regulator [Amylolactobacillus amylotrophicus DSM 20534]KRM41528.1 transcriptional regulator [Amylolactobacillus amylophilus DSM 20533 = JCM 1125]GED80757.1 transcriptional regulator [Amylolactobacillus amylophilus]
MDLYSRVIKEYPNLKGVNRRIAEYIIDNPLEFTRKTAKEISVITKTSAASIVRFVRYFNFNGLQDFKISLVQDFNSINNQSEVLDTIIERTDSYAEISHKLSGFIIDNAKETHNLVDVRILAKIVNVIKNAETIYLEGLSASGLAANDLYYKLIRSNRKAIFDKDSHTAIERSYFMTKKDVVIIFSYSGLTEEMIIIAKQAQLNHTPVILITRKSPSPLMKLADYVFPIPANESLLRIGAVSSLFSEIYASSLIFLSLVNSEIPQLEKNYHDTSKLTKKLKHQNRGINDGH